MNLRCDAIKKLSRDGDNLCNKRKTCYYCLLSTNAPAQARDLAKTKYQTGLPPGDPVRLLRPDPSFDAGTAIFRFVGDWATENTLQLTGFRGGTEL